MLSPFASLCQVSGKQESMDRRLARFGRLVILIAGGLVMGSAAVRAEAPAQVVEVARRWIADHTAVAISVGTSATWHPVL